MTMRRTAILAFTAFALLAGACGGSSNDVTPVPTESVTGGGGTGGAIGGGGAGIANPASVFCEEQGGTLEIVDEAGGQVGYCNLPDGRRIEEWEYYRSMNPEIFESGSPSASA
ncbi:MAG: DUF333 domain-containing protein [Actinomycetota bacterium]